MKAVEFEEQTRVFGADQPEYMPLPAWVNPDPESMGEVVTKWKFSKAELEEVIKNGGEFWFTVCTFHGRRRVHIDELTKVASECDAETGFGYINTGGLSPQRPDAFSPFVVHQDRE